MENQIKSFFFKSMSSGWASGKDEILKDDNAPGYKSIPFQDGDFYLVDRYCVNSESSKSAGTTTIWFKSVPIWVMNYGGFYNENAITFLKQALDKTYSASDFVGGRGPLVYTDGALTYTNKPRLNDFNKFEGREEIIDTQSGTLLGFHEYWGISLL